MNKLLKNYLIFAVWITFLYYYGCSKCRPRISSYVCKPIKILFVRKIFLIHGFFGILVFFWTVKIVNTNKLSCKWCCAIVFTYIYIYLFINKVVVCSVMTLFLAKQPCIKTLANTCKYLRILC